MIVIYDEYCPAYKTEYKNKLQKYINILFPSLCKPTRCPVVFRIAEDIYIMNPTHKY